MRRWAMAAAVVLIAAMLLAGFMQLSSRHDGPASASRMAQLGLVLLDDDAGLYVLGVIDGSLAGSAGIEPGDYLTSARGTPLTAVAQFEELLAGQEGIAIQSLPLTLNRDNQTYTVSLSFQ